MSFYVEIVCKETGEVVKRIETTSESKAERMETGMNINLNHEKYFTRMFQIGIDIGEK